MAVAHRREKIMRAIGVLAAEGPVAEGDILEYQCIGATGLSKLCATYQIHDVAAKVSTLEVMFEMMTNSQQDVRQPAAVAVAELTLHKENARRLCMVGVIKPLLDMACSGNCYQENDAIKAISNLAIAEENQQQLIKEGGQHALKYLELSSNPVKLA